MRKLYLFMMVSLDGYFEGPEHELNWHNVDAEFNEFAIKQLDESDILLFGERTYQMMAEYWSKEEACKDDPIVAGKMNTMPKIVFSRSLEKAEWENTRVVNHNVPEEVRKLKEQSGKDIALLGSNNLAISLAEAGLIDEFRIMVNPVALGKGHALFEGIAEKMKLKLISTKVFASGNVLLSYGPNA